MSGSVWRRGRSQELCVCVCVYFVHPFCTSLSSLLLAAGQDPWVTSAVRPPKVKSAPFWLWDGMSQLWEPICSPPFFSLLSLNNVDARPSSCSSNSVKAARQNCAVHALIAAMAKCQALLEMLCCPCSDCRSRCRTPV